MRVNRRVNKTHTTAGNKSKSIYVAIRVLAHLISQRWLCIEETYICRFTSLYVGEGRVEGEERGSIVFYTGRFCCEVYTVHRVHSYVYGLTHPAVLTSSFTA